ncbi:unnamed protein product [Effrenium voratum]|uniref:J domain-containing protein n=1 Tax=Effrenium voratum TaxID=2562239 RepID=A0AA36JRI1_9DINO|nr:unnamed protein product [Effrenium voratum]
MVPTLTPRRAAARLKVPLGASEAEIRSAYRAAARSQHPDKASGSSEEFLRLGEALEVLTKARPAEAEVEESESLDRRFFGSHFGSDQFDPRAWLGEADPALDELQCVWRCKTCPEQSSVCCRLKPRKHSCLCGHKVEVHEPRRGFRCSSNGCRCERLEFYVQQLGWEARCACKHHVRDHNQLGGAPWPCSKVLPGKDKKPCPCRAFHVAWVCTCGHPYEDHETSWHRAISKAVFAREWVAQGLRPECVAEAEEKRARWQQQAGELAASRGAEPALQAVAAKAKRLQVSMCAEAKMREAVREATDGTRLPRPSRGYPTGQPSADRRMPQDFTEQLHCNVHGCFGEGLTRKLKAVEQMLVQDVKQAERLWASASFAWAACKSPDWTSS